MNIDEFSKNGMRCTTRTRVAQVVQWGGDIHICIAFSELDRVHDIIEKWESEEE